MDGHLSCYCCMGPLHSHAPHSTETYLYAQPLNAPTMHFPAFFARSFQETAGKDANMPPSLLHGSRSRKVLPTTWDQSNHIQPMLWLDTKIATAAFCVYIVLVCSVRSSFGFGPHLWTSLPACHTRDQVFLLQN